MIIPGLPSVTTHGIRRASHRERFQPLAFVTLALRGQRALENEGWYYKMIKQWKVYRVRPGNGWQKNSPYPNLLRSLPQEYWPSLIKANEISATSKAADLLRSLSESEWECEPQRGVNASLSVSALLCADEAVITDWNKGTGRNFTIMDLLSTCAECIIPQNKNS